MAEKENSKQPTHRAYSVIRREGQDDFWLNIGIVFMHKDDSGFNIMLQALPLDGKIVCRHITAEDEDEAPDRQKRSGHNNGRNSSAGNRR